MMTTRSRSRRTAAAETRDATRQDSSQQTEHPDSEPHTSLQESGQQTEDSGSTSMACRRDIITPRPYSTGPWGEYLDYFTTVADNNDWSDAERARKLATSLTGPSATMYRSLSKEIRSNYTLLVDELTRLLDPPEMTNVKKHVFKTRRQLEGEDICLYYSSLKCAGLEAYPSMPHSHFDELLTDRFVEGLSDQRVRYQVQIIAPKHSGEALSVALRVDSVLRMERADNVPTNTGRVSSAPGTNPTSRSRTPEDRPQARRRQPPTCWTCGGVGHVSRFCKANESDKRPLNANRPV